MHVAAACAPSGFRLRAAVAADAGALAELGATTFVETFGAHNDPTDVAAHLASHFSPALQAAEIADGCGRMLLAEQDGQLVGYARTVDGRAPASVRAARPRELARLYVRQRNVGGGLGPALMRRVLDDAHADGHDVLWLGVWEHNPRARRFYEKWGFVEVGEIAYQLGDDTQRDLVLAIDLPAAGPTQ